MPDVHDLLFEAAARRGWTTDLRQRLGSGPNPTRVDLRNGRTVQHLLVYAWRITGEGKGRTGSNFRIQTTRTHSGPLLSEEGRVSIGAGWDATREVFVVFDAWTKRFTGHSSSVHITDELIERARSEGHAIAGPPWDARLAFSPSEVDRLSTWLDDMAARRTALLEAVDVERPSDQLAEVVGDVWGGHPTQWLRAGDNLVITDGDGVIADDSLWRVQTIQAEDVLTTSGRYNRTHLRFSCHRIGRVADPDALRHRFEQPTT